MAKKIAIGSWAYCFGPYSKNPVGLDETIQKLKELKFDGIELCGFPPHATPEAFPNKASRKALKAKLADAGLGIAGYAANFCDVPPAVTPKAKYERVFKKNLALCKDLGCPKIRVDTVSGPFFVAEGKVGYATAFKNTAAAWASGAKMAADAGIKLVWEFEPGFLFNKPSEVVKMIEAVNHPNFTILFDTCHAHMCSVVAARQPEPKETLKGGAVAFAGLLKGQIGHIHLIDSDNTLHGDETSTHAPFGKGVLNFDELMPAILKAGYTDEWWSVDLCFWPQAWEVTADAKKVLDGLRTKYGK